MNPRENPDTASGKPSANSRARKWSLFAFKAAVSAAAVWLIARGVDLGEAAALLAGSDKALWFAALLCMVLSQVLSTYRWKILLAPMDFRLPWVRVFSIYFVGMFFSLFLPSLVGGDGVKTYYIADEWKRVPAAVYTLLADRTLGLAAMLLYGAAGTVLMWSRLPEWLALSMLAFAAGVYGVLILLPRLSAPALFLLRKVRDVPAERLFTYWDKPAPAMRAWGLSVVIHLCLVAGHLAMAAALDVGVPPAAWLVIYPLAALAAFLPVSLNGIGLREGTYVYMLGLFGANRELALSLGIMWFTIVVMNGLLGGLPYLFGGALRERGAHAG